MLLPKNPKVVVIDDHFEEVEGLLYSLSRHGTSYIFLNGDPKNDPEIPFVGVRLVILDIDLEKRTSNATDIRSKASILAQMVTKILDSKTSPFFILFWTKNKNVIAPFLKYLKACSSLYPIATFNMEKPTLQELKTMSINDFDLKLQNSINLDAFNFLLSWENMILNEASNFIDDFSKISIPSKITKNSQILWNDSILEILSKLACSFVDNNQIDDNERLIYSSLFFNQSFSAKLPELSNLNIKIPQNSKLAVEKIAILNTNLFFNNNLIDKKIQNGRIFEEHNGILLNSLKTYSGINNVVKHGVCKLCGIIVTPSCDIAHEKKLVKNGEKKFHRVLYGLDIKIYKKNLNLLTDSLNKINSEAVYQVNPFYIDNYVHVIFFIFGTIISKPLCNGDKAFIYELNESVVHDLQTKLANHVNRLGNSMISIK